MDAWDYRIVPGTVYMYFAKYDSILLRYPVRSGSFVYAPLALVTTESRPPWAPN